MSFIRSRWTPLFLSNFLSVFNDNFLKYAIVFIGISWSMPAWLTRSQLISAVSASLILPYLFLSPLGGRLAVIYSKKSVFRLFKLLEIPIMLLASIAFYFQWVFLAVFAVLLMGIQSCLYSPSKYSLIRDIGGETGVSFGSGVFEMMAFLGILTATVSASLVSDDHLSWIVYLVFLGVAISGYLVTRAIRANELPENKENTGTLNPVLFLMASFRFARQHENLNAAVFGASSFWLIGGMMQMNVVVHAKEFYRVPDSLTGAVMAIAAIGIALGTWLAGKISNNEVKKGLILPGITGMSLVFAVLTFVHVPFWLFTVLVFGAAFFGGFFQIPCLSMLQRAPIGRKLGDMIAYLNLVTFIFILLGTLFFSLTTQFTGENSFAVFGVILIICLSVAAFFAMKSPDFRSDAYNLISRKKR
jgi:acyl-[acyl-carrier-protein]-phospholipid O-acyltransferase/long-chain-fatty-acid--[acyl-carrier-protein] ligase